MVPEAPQVTTPSPWGGMAPRAHQGRHFAQAQMAPVQLASMQLTHRERDWGKDSVWHLANFKVGPPGVLWWPLHPHPLCGYRVSSRGGAMLPHGR